MALPSPQDAAQRYGTQAGSAGQRYVEGAQRTDKDPTALAAAQGQKALNNFTQSITSGRWQRRLQEVGRTGWLNGITSKGAQNYATGVAAGVPKYQAAMQTWFPIFSSIQNEIDGMPNTTLQDSIARATRWIERTAAAKQQMG